MASNSAPELSENMGQDTVLVVGIGASAGGLEAITEVIRGLSAGHNLAIVIAQHMAPTHKSLMPALLAKDCALPVRLATDGEQLRPDHVYVGPSDKDIVVEDNKIRLLAPSSDSYTHPSVDRLFRSIAVSCNENAVGIVLSGTGNDGTLGLQAIQDVQGITIVQSPETARYDAMPLAAIDAGLANLVLPPGEIAAQLSELTPLGESGEVEIFTGQLHEITLKLPRILQQVKSKTGHDFSSYKHGTIERQILKRMRELNVSNVRQYIEYIDTHLEEPDELKQSFMISVTNFFRNPSAFDVLKSQLLNHIESNAAELPVRIWVPACATGQEVYSIAITLVEALGSRLERKAIKIFATDTDEAALSVARSAFYPLKLCSDISDERLARFFDREEKGYRVKQWIRDMCVFAKHNVITDPPFLRLNLISCRNLFIYLSLRQQQQTVRIFNYSLLPEGLLFLGKSEGPGADNDHLFKTLDRGARLYCKLSSGHNILKETPGDISAQHSNGLIKKGLTHQQRQVADSIKDILIEAFSPPTIHLSQDFYPIEFFGDLSKYLCFTAGKPNFDAASLVKESLRTEVRALINRAARTDDTVITHLSTLRNDESQTLDCVRVSLRRFSVARVGVENFLLSFETLPDKTVEASGSEEILHPSEELEEELSRTRDHLRSVIEQLSTNNEELLSMNEELQASSEELQAAVEQMETSNEELQASNQELKAVNDQLTAKDILLDDANETLTWMHHSLGLGIVLLDENQRICSFTPHSARLFGILHTDIGRKLSNIPTQIPYELVESLIHLANNKKESVKKPVWVSDRLFLLTAAPFRSDRYTGENTILTLLDVTELHGLTDKSELKR